MPAPVVVKNLDHIVLQVADPEKALAWYVEKFDLTPLRVEEFRAGEVPFPSVQVSPGTIIDLDPRTPRTGTNVAHYCIVIEETDMIALAGSGDFDVVGGPFRRWGALGPADLIYVRDLDGNVIELRHYGPTQLSE